jgi:hypothetical protein
MADTFALMHIPARYYQVNNKHKIDVEHSKTVDFMTLEAFGSSILCSSKGFTSDAATLGCDVPSFFMLGLLNETAVVASSVEVVVVVGSSFSINNTVLAVLLWVSKFSNIHEYSSRTSK